MAKPEFLEDWHSERLDPLVEPHADFDYDEIDRRLGWREPGEAEEKPEERLLSHETASLVHDRFASIGGKINSFEQAGRKFKAAFALTPDLTDAERKAVAAISIWVCDVGLNNNQYGRSREYRIGQRAISLGWLVNPGYFEGSPSLRELATRFGVSAPVLSNYVAQAARDFGIVNRAQDQAAQARVRAAVKRKEASNA